VLVKARGYTGSLSACPDKARVPILSAFQAAIPPPRDHAARRAQARPRRGAPRLPRPGSHRRRRTSDRGRRPCSAPSRTAETARPQAFRRSGRVGQGRARRSRDLR